MIATGLSDPTTGASLPLVQVLVAGSSPKAAHKLAALAARTLENYVTSEQAASDVPQAQRVQFSFIQDGAQTKLLSRPQQGHLASPVRCHLGLRNRPRGQIGQAHEAQRERFLGRPLVTEADDALRQRRTDSASLPPVRHERSAGAPLPTSAVLTIGAVGLLAIDILRGGQGEIPAVGVIGLLLGIRAVSFLADWRRVVMILLLVVLLIPNDGRYTLPGGLPFQLEPYRVVVGIFLIGWIASLLTDPRVRFRTTTFEGPLLLLTLTVLCSEVVNASRVSVVESYVIKSVSLLVCFVLVVYMLVSVLRTRETLDRVIAIMVGAGCIVAVAALIQMKTGTNFFDDLHLVLRSTSPLFRRHYRAEDALSDGLRRASHRAQCDDEHADAVCHISRDQVPQASVVASVRVLLLGEFASGSKTGMLGVAAMVGISCGCVHVRPSASGPPLVPMLVVVHFLAPGALGGVYGGFFSSGGLVAQQGATSTEPSSRVYRARTALHEFSEHNPLLGEGYGTRVTGGEAELPGVAAQTTTPCRCGQRRDEQRAASSWRQCAGPRRSMAEDPAGDGHPRRACLGWLFVRAIRRLGARAKIERGSPDGSPGSSRVRAPRLRDPDGHL